MNAQLGENQLAWCRKHIIKDGQPIFEIYEKNKSTRVLKPFEKEPHINSASD